MNQKWANLSAALNDAGGYYEPRLTARLLGSRYHARRAVIRETGQFVGNRKIRAYAALWRTGDSQWYELGTVWIAECLRGNRLCKTLMSEAVGLAPSDTNLFMITTVQSVMDSAQAVGFVPITKAVMPEVEALALLVGLGNRLPATALQTTEPCPKAGERWLFVRGA